MNFSVEPLCNVHSHLREGEEVMKELIALQMQGGVDVILPMPNTVAGLITCKEVVKYKRLAQSLAPKDLPLRLLPTLMITEETPQSETLKCPSAGIKDAKIFPRLRTTKSHNGVRDYGKLLSIVQSCAENAVKVHLHPEHPWMMFNNRDAEFAFLSIADILLRQTDATIIWEHGTDARCIPFWKEMAETERFFVTLTAHHLAANEDSAFGNVRLVCKPPVKTEQDRQALIRLVEEDHPWVMAGGDDAPHDINAKHIHHGQCACGAYTGPFLLQLYAHALDDMLEKKARINAFINFTSRNARALHQLPNPSARIFLARETFQVPSSYQIGPWKVEPPFAGEKIKYSLVS